MLYIALVGFSCSFSQTIIDLNSASINYCLTSATMEVYKYSLETWVSLSNYY